MGSGALDSRSGCSLRWRRGGCESPVMVFEDCSSLLARTSRRQLRWEPGQLEAKRRGDVEVAQDWWRSWRERPVGAGQLLRAGRHGDWWVQRGRLDVQGAGWDPDRAHHFRFQPNTVRFRPLTPVVALQSLPLPLRRPLPTTILFSLPLSVLGTLHPPASKRAPSTAPSPFRDAPSIPEQDHCGLRAARPASSQQPTHANTNTPSAALAVWPLAAGWPVCHHR